MTSEEYTVTLVHSTSYAIRAEKILREAGIQSKLIPVPRHLSSSCGVCVRIARVNRETAQRALQQAGLEVDSVHDV
jgi:ribosomal protein S11